MARGPRARRAALEQGEAQCRMRVREVRCDRDRAFRRDDGRVVQGGELVDGAVLVGDRRQRAGARAMAAALARV